MPVSNRPRQSARRHRAGGNSKTKKKQFKTESVFCVVFALLHKHVSLPLSRATDTKFYIEQPACCGIWCLNQRPSAATKIKTVATNVCQNSAGTVFFIPTGRFQEGNCKRHQKNEANNKRSPFVKLVWFVFAILLRREFCFPCFSSEICIVFFFIFFLQKPTLPAARHIPAAKTRNAMQHPITASVHENIPPKSVAVLCSCFVYAAAFVSE